LRQSTGEHRRHYRPSCGRATGSSDLAVLQGSQRNERHADAELIEDLLDGERSFGGHGRFGRSIRAGRVDAVETAWRVADVEAEFSITPQAVYKWIRENKVEAEKTPGGSYRLPPSQFTRRRRLDRSRLAALQRRLLERRPEPTGDHAEIAEEIRTDGPSSRAASMERQPAEFQLGLRPGADVDDCWTRLPGS